MKTRPNSPGPPVRPACGLARALSKLGFCSRSHAWDLIKSGRARVNGVLRRNPEWPVDLKQDRLEVDGQTIQPERKVYLMLNKPRGLVTTAADERGRQTVFTCLQGKGFPPVMPVGRLDQASEGLLLFTNDTAWAARITDPASGIEKTYHVQVNCVADEALARQLEAGSICQGDRLKAKSAKVLRLGEKNSWLEIVLDEGKNRHIRRLLASFGIEVLRLIRIQIGKLSLGDLGKGKVRELNEEEISISSRSSPISRRPKLRY